MTRVVTHILDSKFINRYLTPNLLILTLKSKKTSIFKNKRIVLFDTLMDQVHDDEILAILGHELGEFFWAKYVVPKHEHKTEKHCSK